VKRIKLLVLAITSVSALVAATSTLASMPLPIGWYAEGNVGGTSTSNASYGPGLSTSSPGRGWNLNIGYKFMPYFAGEGGYTSYAKAKIKSNTTSVAQDVHKSYYLAGKGILPISDSGFELFAKLGIARINGHVTITNPTYASAKGLSINAGTHYATGAYFGVGGDYSFMPSLSLNFQWNRSKGNTQTGNLDLYSVGLTWLFS
jgi:hypothetical protein